MDRAYSNLFRRVEVEKGGPDKWEADLKNPTMAVRKVLNRKTLWLWTGALLAAALFVSLWVPLVVSGSVEGDFDSMSEADGNMLVLSYLFVLAWCVGTTVFWSWRVAGRRLRSMGYSPWFAAPVVVPILGWFLYAPLLALFIGIRRGPT